MRKPTVTEDVSGYRGGQRTALKKVRHLGSAKDGTDHFIRQRVTAAANVVLVLVLVFVAISLSGKDYAQAVELVGSPWVAVPLALAFVSVAMHLKLGLQVVIEDYIHGEGPRIALLVLATFFTIAVAGLALYAILRVMFAAAAAPVV